MKLISRLIIITHAPHIHTDRPHVYANNNIICQIRESIKNYKKSWEWKNDMNEWIEENVEKANNKMKKEKKYEGKNQKR